jgi:hypothetical protein
MIGAKVTRDIALDGTGCSCPSRNRTFTWTLANVTAQPPDDS